jgi:hypothetical protein
MNVRMFRRPGQETPAKPPLFPHKPPANSPPYRLSHPHQEVRRAIAATEATRRGEG